MSQATQLFNRNFTLLLAGGLVSRFGSQLFLIAQAFWVKHQFDSASLVGLMIMVGGLPAVVFGPIAGACADRFPRRSILIVCDLVNGAAILVTGAVLAGVGEPGLGLAALFVTAALVGTMNAFFRPAVSAAIPSLVRREDLGRANGLRQAGGELFALVAQLIGGILFRVLGAVPILIVNGISYLVSAAGETLIRIPHKPAAEATVGGRALLAGLWRDTRQGFAFVWGNDATRALFISLAVMDIFLAPFAVLMPFYVEDTLGLAPDWYGYFFGAFGIGMLVGSLLLGLLRLSFRTRGLVMLWIMPVFAILIGQLAVVRSGPLVMALFGLMGLSIGCFQVGLTTIMQVKTPDHLRGRLFGFRTTLGCALTPLSMGAAGILSDVMGRDIPLVFACSSGLLFLIAVWLAFKGVYRAYLTDEAPCGVPTNEAMGAVG